MLAVNDSLRSYAANLPSRLLQALSLALLALLGATCALLLIMRGAPSLWLFDPHGDFTVFYGAAKAVMHGHNPYDDFPLFRYLPAIIWIARPFALGSQEQGYLLWVAFLLLCLAGTLLLLARQYGSTVYLYALTLSPAAALAVMVAQPVVLVTLALAAATVALERDREIVAGILLAAIWLKPQLALPAICLFGCRSPRVLLTFGIASIPLFADPLLPAWLHQMGIFAVEHETVQASLAGLWPGVLGPHHPGYLIVAGVALAASIFVLRRGGSSARILAVLSLIWFIAAPYSHAYDVTLLLVPLAVLGTSRSSVLLNCWLSTLLSFYTLPMATLVAPLLLLTGIAQRSRAIHDGMGSQHSSTIDSAA
jgi:hypothetical protein